MSAPRPAFDGSIGQAAKRLAGDRHRFDTEHVNRGIVRAICSCGWRMPIGRRKAAAAADDWDMHVLIFESRTGDPSYERCHSEADFQAELLKQRSTNAS